MEGNKAGNQDWRGLYARPIRQGDWRNKDEQRGSHDRIRRRLASPHRAVISRRMALCIAIALVSLEVLDLVMVQGTVRGVAASR